MRIKFLTMSLSLGTFLLTLTSILPINGSFEAQAGDGEAIRLILTPRSGDALHINFPGNPGLGGFTGALFTVEEENEVGSFATDIISPSSCDCSDIETFLGALIANHFQLQPSEPFASIAVASAVAGRFEISNGVIFDEHRATVFVLPEPAVTPNFDIVVAAIGDGVITGGTGKYKKASGTTSLYLKMEVDIDDPDSELPVVRALTGSFLFDFD